MKIHFRACVQGIHHHHAEMISDATDDHVTG